MSVLLTKRGPLPAVAFAAAFAAATPPAEAGAVVPGSTAISEEIAALLAEARAASAERAMALLAWASTAHVDWREATSAPGDLEGHLAAHFDRMQGGFTLLRQWADDSARDIIRRTGATWREANALARTARIAAEIETHDAIKPILEAAALVSDSMDTLVEAAEARFRPARRQLVAFTIRAQTQAAPPRRTALAASLTQPFFDLYGAVLNIEASVRRTIDWDGLRTVLDKAESLAVQFAASAEHAPLSIHVDLANRFAGLTAGLDDLRRMMDGNVRIMAAAKVQFLALLGDVSKLALKEMPEREARRVLRTRPPGEAAAAEPASLDPNAPRTFGRRIDFDGLAHRYLTGDEY